MLLHHDCKLFFRLFWCTTLQSNNNILKQVNTTHFCKCKQFLQNLYSSGICIIEWMSTWSSNYTTWFVIHGVNTQTQSYQIWFITQNESNTKLRSILCVLCFQTCSKPQKRGEATSKISFVMPHLILKWAVFEHIQFSHWLHVSTGRASVLILPH